MHGEHIRPHTLQKISHAVMLGPQARFYYLSSFFLEAAVRYALLLPALVGSVSMAERDGGPINVASPPA